MLAFMEIHYSVLYHHMFNMLIVHYVIQGLIIIAVQSVLWQVVAGALMDPTVSKVHTKVQVLMVVQKIPGALEHVETNNHHI